MTPIINRSVAIVKPKQPFVDWANALGGGLTLTLAEYRQDTTAYLFPDLEEAGDEERFLRRHVKFIFEHELAGWSTDERTWPKRRGIKTFLAWFEIEFHSLVVELGRGGIWVEEL